MTDNHNNKTPEEEGWIILPESMLTEEEICYIEVNQQRCRHCKHLMILHTIGCNIPDCNCPLI